MNSSSTPRWGHPRPLTVVAPVKLADEDVCHVALGVHATNHGAICCLALVQRELPQAGPALRAVAGAGGDGAVLQGALSVLLSAGIGS